MRWEGMVAQLPETIVEHSEIFDIEKGISKAYDLRIGFTLVTGTSVAEDR